MDRSLHVPGPHDGALILQGGAPIAEAAGALILVHGRGADAAGMLELATYAEAGHLAWVAPEAVGRTWYPYPFMTPIAQNQPHLDSALALLGAVSAKLEAEGIPAARQFLLGFSQGACLSLEFAARSNARWAGVIGLSGGVIGPAGTPRDYPAGVAGTPVFLGCSDVDSHIPVTRVHETRDLFTRLGAHVDERIYPGMPHTIADAEMVEVRRLLATLHN
jgi:phospholipase/carboxylesterase